MLLGLGMGAVIVVMLAYLAAITILVAMNHQQDVQEETEMQLRDRLDKQIIASLLESDKRLARNGRVKFDAEGKFHLEED